VLAVPMFDRFKIDDPVGALSVHLVNGIWGTLAVGIFAQGVSFLDQLKGVIFVAIFVFVISFLVLFVINKIITFKMDADDEMLGLDITECGIEAYPEFRRTI